MNKKSHILIAEDEAQLASVLGDYLSVAGHSHSWVSRGDRVQAALREQHVDLLLLDLMLPGKDGIDVCRDVRKQSNVPIIMLTARVDEIDRLIGLEVGADDYVCKPFSPREVIARINAVLRRANAPPTSPGSLSLRFDDDWSFAYYGAYQLDLTTVEFRLLRALASSPGRVFSRDQLLDRIYTDGRVVSDRTIDTHIKNIRRKLEEVDGSEWITSIYGVGYRISA